MELSPRVYWVAKAAAARAAAEMVWRTGCTSVAERLAEAVRRLSAGRDADNSEMAARGLWLETAGKSPGYRQEME